MGNAMPRSQLPKPQFEKAIADVCLGVAFAGVEVLVVAGLVIVFMW